MLNNLNITELRVSDYCHFRDIYELGDKINYDSLFQQKMISTQIQFLFKMDLANLHP